MNDNKFSNNFFIDNKLGTSVVGVTRDEQYSKTNSSNSDTKTIKIDSNDTHPIMDTMQLNDNPENQNENLENEQTGGADNDEMNVKLNNFRDFVEIGDLVECTISKNRDGNIIGYITYLSDKRIEISASSSSVLHKQLNIGNEHGDKNKSQTAIYEFSIKKGANGTEHIMNIDKMIIKDKNETKGYLDFQGIKLNSKVQIRSKKNKKLNNKIGFVKYIADDNNNVTIELSDKNVIKLDVQNGLSIKDDVYEIETLYEIINKNSKTENIDITAGEDEGNFDNKNTDDMEMDFDFDLNDVIEFTKSDALIVTETTSISEKNYICSKLEGNEILTNELMKNMEWTTDKYKKYENVKDIVANLQLLLDEIEDIDTKNDNNDTINNVLKNDFTNMNTIPIVTSKYGRDIEYFADDDINMDNQSSEKVEYQTYNGYKTIVKQDMNMMYKQYNGDNLIMNRYIGVLDKPDIFLMESEKSSDILNSKTTYHPDYWKSNGMTRRIELYGGDNVNIIGMCVIPNTLVNFSMATNNIELSKLNKYTDDSKYKLLNKKQAKARELIVDNNAKIDINYDIYNKHMLKIYFNNEREIYEEDYSTILKQLYPPPLNLLTKHEKNNIQSIEDINEKLSLYNLNINNIPSKDAIELRDMLTENVEKRFTEMDKSIYKIQYKNLKVAEASEENNKLNSLLNDDLFTSEQFVNIYGEYPYLNKKIDSTIMRYNWITNQKDNGYYFFMNTINENNTSEDNMITEYDLKEKKIIVDKINYHKQEIGFIEEKLNESINNGNCMDLHISKIYLSIDELTLDNNKPLMDDDNEPIKLGDICLLIEKENYRLFKRTKFNGNPMWIETENVLDNLLSISFGKKINKNAEKYYEKLKKKCEINMCNKQKDCVHDVVIIKENNRDKCISKEAYLLNYQIKENKIAKEFYERLLKDIDSKAKSNKKQSIKNDNIIFKLKSEREKKQLDVVNENDNSIKKSSKLMKKFEELIKIENVNDKNQMIYEFINTRLRQANPNEDADWYYNPDSTEKIAAKDWLIETLITIEPQNSNYYSKKLILEYSMAVDGHYVSIIDGRILMPLEDDDFMGYDNDDGGSGTNDHRTLIIDDNTHEKEEMNKKLSSIIQMSNKYRLKTTIDLLCRFVIGTTLIEKDSLFIYENVYETINTYHNSYIFRTDVFSTFVKNAGGRRPNNNNMHDREKLYKIEHDMISFYTIKKLSSLFAIMLQTSTNKYNINQNNCTYSLMGKPYEEIEFTDNSVIKFIACVLKSISMLENFNTLKNRNEENIFNFLLNDYKEWYKNGQIKLLFKELEKREQKWLNVSSIENVWVGFKPNPKLYDNNTNNKHVLLKTIDDIIDDNKNTNNDLSEYSSNCCLNKIDDTYVSYFMNTKKDTTTKNNVNADSDVNTKKFIKNYEELTENNNTKQKNNSKKTNNIDDMDYMINKNIHIENSRLKLDHYNVMNDNIILERKNQEIYPNKINEELSVELFMKYDTKGHKRLINYDISKCLTSNVKSELFSMKYQDQSTSITMSDKLDILKKEGNKYSEQETQKIINNINSHNRIELQTTTAFEEPIFNILKKISTSKVFNEDSSLKIFVAELEKLYDIWDTLNNDDKEKAKEEVSSLLIHNSSKSIQKTQNYIIHKSLSRCDDNDITLEQLHELDDNVDIIYKKAKKNTYKKYFEKMIVNLSKFVNYKKNKKISTPQSWSIPQEQVTSLSKNIEENNEIHTLFNNYQTYSENTMACVRETMEQFVNISKLLNSMTFDNDQKYNSKNEIIKINKFTHEDYFFICKHVHYMALNYLFRTTAIDQYNMLACELFAIFFNQMIKIDSTFNVSREDVESEFMKVREDDKQMHLKRKRDMTEEEKEIDKLLEKYQLDFYGKQGAEDWERGMASLKKNNNSDDLDLISTTKIDKGSEYNDIMMQELNDDFE